MVHYLGGHRSFIERCGSTSGGLLEEEAATGAAASTSSSLSAAFRWGGHFTFAIFVGPAVVPEVLPGEVGAKGRVGCLAVATFVDPTELDGDALTSSTAGEASDFKSETEDTAAVALAISPLFGDTGGAKLVGAL